MSRTRPDRLPYCVPLDWYWHRHVGDGKYVNFYSNTPPRFEHRCDRTSTDRGVIICAPLLDLHVVDEATCTVTPSILCSDCGTHGYVRNGQWTAV